MALPTPLPGKALRLYQDIVSNSLPGDAIRVYIDNLSTVITGTNPPTNAVSILPTTTDQQAIVGAGYIRTIRVGGTASAQRIILYDTAAGPGGTEIYRLDCKTNKETVEFTVGIPFTTGVYVDFQTANDTSVYIEWSSTPGTAIYPPSGANTIIKSAAALTDQQLFTGPITVKRITMGTPGAGVLVYSATLYDIASGPGGTGVEFLASNNTILTQYYAAGLRFTNGIYLDVAGNAPSTIYIEY